MKWSVDFILTWSCIRHHFSMPEAIPYSMTKMELLNWFPHNPACLKVAPVSRSSSQMMVNSNIVHPSVRAKHKERVGLVSCLPTCPYGHYPVLEKSSCSCLPIAAGAWVLTRVHQLDLDQLENSFNMLWWWTPQCGPCLPSLFLGFLGYCDYFAFAS